jgi:Ankyrin repeats (3 copies)/Ankyrin repeats (many copies)
MTNEITSESLLKQVAECIEAVSRAGNEGLPELDRRSRGIPFSIVTIHLPTLQSLLEEKKLQVKEGGFGPTSSRGLSNALLQIKNKLDLLAEVFLDFRYQPGEETYWSWVNKAKEGDALEIKIAEIYRELAPYTKYISRFQPAAVANDTLRAPEQHSNPESSSQPDKTNPTSWTSPSTGFDVRNGQTSHPAVSEPSPLFVASKRGQESIVRFLLDQGADVNDGGRHIPPSSWSPLCTASNQGHESTVRLLLDRGANVHAADHTGWTAIATASKYGHAGVVSLLLQRGADPSAVDRDNWTPLHTAAMHGKAEVVRVLLDYGADSGAKDILGRTPMVVAIRKGDEAIVRLLAAYMRLEPPPSYETSMIESANVPS